MRSVSSLVLFPQPRAAWVPPPLSSWSLTWQPAELFLTSLWSLHDISPGDKQVGLIRGSPHFLPNAVCAETPFMSSFFSFLFDRLRQKGKCVSCYFILAILGIFVKIQILFTKVLAGTREPMSLRNFQMISVLLERDCVE